MAARSRWAAGAAASGGRKPLTGIDAGLLDALDALVEPETRGDPMTRLRGPPSPPGPGGRAGEPGAPGLHPQCRQAAGRAAGLQPAGQRQTLEGREHPDRDAQFRYIARRVAAALAAGEPVISVDAKKKELIGRYARAGREWRPSGDPRRADVHDFPGEQGKAVPYGVTHPGRRRLWVSVGSDGDTAQFAVQTIRRWWDSVATTADPGIVAPDHRRRGRLQWLPAAAVEEGNSPALADATGLAITTCHMPPGTSKWNKIQQRLFSYISMNWAGQPLTSHEVAVNLIAGTTTRTGLTVRAERDTSTYPRGINITDREMKTLTAQHRHPAMTGTASGTTPSPRPAHPVERVVHFQRLSVREGCGERTRPRRMTPVITGQRGSLCRARTGILCTCACRCFPAD